MSSEMLLRLGWDQFWQVTLLIVLVSMLTRTVLRTHPKWCHLLWIVVLVKCLVPPVFSSPLGLFSWSSLHVHEVDILERQAFSHQTLDWLSAQLTQTVVLGLGAIWLGGALFQMAVTAIRWRRVYVAVTRNSAVTSAPVIQAFESVCKRLDVRNTRVFVTREPIGPAVLGVFHRSLVLPSEIVEGKSAVHIEPILAHELLHVRRGDTLAALLQAVVQIVWWFNPMTWWASHEASFQCERCADEDVLTAMQYPPRFYANSLLEVLESKCRLHPIFGSAGMNAMQINTARLRDIMRTDRRPCNRGALRVTVAMLLLVLLLPGAGYSIAPQFFSPTREYKPNLPPDYKCFSIEFADGSGEIGEGSTLAR